MHVRFNIIILLVFHIFILPFIGINIFCIIYAIFLLIIIKDFFR